MIQNDSPSNNWERYHPETTQVSGWYCLIGQVKNGGHRPDKRDFLKFVLDVVAVAVAG